MQHRVDFSFDYHELLAEFICKRWNHRESFYMYMNNMFVVMLVIYADLMNLWGLLKKGKHNSLGKVQKASLKVQFVLRLRRAKLFQSQNFILCVCRRRSDWLTSRWRKIDSICFLCELSLHYYGVFHSLIFLGSFCKLDWTLCIHRRTVTWLVIVMKHIEFAFYFHLQERFQSWFPYFFAARLLQPLRVRESFFK